MSKILLVAYIAFLITVLLIALTVIATAQPNEWYQAFRQAEAAAIADLGRPYDNLAGRSVIQSTPDCLRCFQEDEEFDDE